MDKIDRTIRRRFSASFMNNKKWVKVLEALHESHDSIIECRVKLVARDEIFSMHIGDCSGYGFDYYDSTMEAMIAGNKAESHYDYKEIEWMEIPKSVLAPRNYNNLKAGKHEVEQDVELFKIHLMQLGQFEVEDTKDGFRIYGYK